MFKSKLYMIIVILSMLSPVFQSCANSPEKILTATPLQVSKEGSPGEYLDVRIQLSNDQPCILKLTTVHKTEIDNYLARYTTKTLTYPDNNKIVVWHEQIPSDTSPGNYVLRVFQMTQDGDTEGKEILSQDFKVK